MGPGPGSAVRTRVGVWVRVWARFWATFWVRGWVSVRVRARLGPGQGPVWGEGLPSIGSHMSPCNSSREAARRWQAPGGVVG